MGADQRKPIGGYCRLCKDEGNGATSTRELDGVSFRYGGTPRRSLRLPSVARCYQPVAAVRRGVGRYSGRISKSEAAFDSGSKTVQVFGSADELTLAANAAGWGIDCAAEDGQLNFHTAILAIIQARGGSDEFLVELADAAHGRMVERLEIG
jgi:hypothetical protein